MAEQPVYGAARDGVSTRIASEPETALNRIRRELAEKRQISAKIALDAAFVDLYGRQRVDSDAGRGVELTGINASVPVAPIPGPTAAPVPKATQSAQFNFTVLLLVIGCIPSMLGVYVIAWVDETKGKCNGYADVKGGAIQSLSLMCVSATMLLFMMLSRFYIASSKGYWVRALLYKREEGVSFVQHVVHTRLRVICFLLLLTWMFSSSGASRYYDEITACSTDGVYGFFVSLPVAFSTILLFVELAGRLRQWWRTEVPPSMEGVDTQRADVLKRDVTEPPGKFIITGITLCMWSVVVARQQFLFDSDGRNTCAALGVVGVTLFPLLVFSTAVCAFVLASSYLVDNAHAFTGRVLSLCVAGYTIFAVLFIYITKSSKARSCDSRTRVNVLDWLIVAFGGLMTVLALSSGGVIGKTQLNFDISDAKYTLVRKDIGKDDRDNEVLQLRF
jgi:hypothetical protein